MKKVKLYTEDGKYVVTAIIPDFILAPRVMIWGSRYFVWSDEHDQYREQFTIAVVQHEFEDHPNTEV